MQQELDHFLKQYEQAANSCNFDNVAPFLADDALFWFTNGTFKGLEVIRRAFEETWANIKGEVYTITDVEWLAVSNMAAVCTYTFKSDGLVDGKRQVYRGRGTNVLINKDSRWLIAHEHLSKSPES